MGVLPKHCCTPGLMWVFGLLFCALLLHANTQVSADSKEESDLVFDSLESTNLRNNRIARESNSYSYSESSQPVEEHWLSRTVNRIKRSIGSIFSKNEQQPNNHHKVHKDHHEKTLAHHHNEDINENLDHHAKLNRKHRQSDYDDIEEEEEYYDLGQEEDDYDTLGIGQGQFEDNEDEHDDDVVVNGYNYFDNLNDNDFDNLFDKQSANIKPDVDLPPGTLPTNNDDEDFLDGSGKDGSGEIDTEPAPTSTTAKPVGHPKYYRFTFTVQDYYTDEFADRNSLAFQELSDKIRTSVNQLFAAKTGEQTATVISIEKDESDTFQVRTTVDLESIGWYDDEAIRKVIYDELQIMHRLGSVTAVPDNFVFRTFEDNRPPCNENQMICNNNQCVDQSARCNGIRDCSDNSDEEGCPPPTIRPTEPAPTVQPESVTDAPTTYHYIIPNITTTTTTTTPIPDFGSGDGEGEDKDRSDDKFTCEDGIQTLYGDQRCDGIAQCNDGSDERNCHEEPKCAQGEYSCDVTRCIPFSSRCDGLKDCSDDTDEQECYSCASEAFHCDESRCIPRDRLCDRNPDCRDGTDEHNCKDSQCLPSEFSCGDGQCIPDYLRCSGSPECSNREDERNCNTACLDTDFHCNNGFCIPQSQRCDGTRQCQDSSDEMNCENRHQCQHYQWQCDNGQCIDQIERCNRRVECGDGSDEINCTFCRQDSFRCNNGSCITLDKRCNGVGDCPNSEDEEQCEMAYCRPAEFRCQNGECIYSQLVCDGRYDCSDKSDENGCSGSQDCPDGGYRCSEGFCIMGYKRCNGIKDCDDNSDEENCPTPSPDSHPHCTASEFTCADGLCVDISFHCDGIPDCYDRSDEVGCNESPDTPPTTYPQPGPYPPPTPTPQEICSPDQIACQDGTCAYGTRCDRKYDCLDGTDEIGCEYCRSTEFQCRSGGCIDSRLRCDQLRDCRDGSDEEGCGCSSNEIDCGDGTCVELSRRCDGRADCQSGRDEEGCSRNRTQPSTCKADEFDCGNRECIQNNYRCDGYDDCTNRADEQHCECQPSQHRCNDGSCIPLAALCDRNYDCPDGSDESNCTRHSCQSNEFRCESDSRCISNRQRCDRYPDCADGSDEQGCEKCLEPEWFQCEDGSGCIEETLKCDNVYDCKDFSDEQNCFDCYANEFRCSNGDCVDERLRCNGRPDCRDYSDEYNCPITTTREPFITLPPVTSSPVSCPVTHVTCASEDQCIPRGQLCDGRVDCRDSSDESRCGSSAEGLQLRTYPSQQNIDENQEVVFQCRDEGPIRARVEWRRANGLSLPEGSRDINGRLEMPNIKVEHGGTYVCVAKDYPPGTLGAEIAVQLHVKNVTTVVIPTYPVCPLNQSTCANGECIARNKVCDGTYDCSDGSDEIRCRHCEPNEFKCENKKCVHRSWVCDGQDDCGDGSDERVCAPSRPGEGCGSQQFTCRSSQCVPRSFHCDGQPDCMDRSDEIGCTPPIIAEPPPSMISLKVGQMFTITCRAVGVPTPEIIWRLNWHHVPTKCRMTSEKGFGTLICEDIQVEDQGAYSCEAMSSLKTVFASPDTILTVVQDTPCRPGYFNVEARSESECIKCFCFGHTSSCRSADLFVFQFQPPFDSLKMLGARIDPYTGVVDIRDEPIYQGVEPQLQQLGRNGVKASIPYFAELNQPNVVPYFALPENYHGNQLKSYGGYLRYNIYHGNSGRPIPGPDVILSGNNYVLLHQSRTSPPPFRTTEQRVRFFDGDWIIKSANQPERSATREEVMMALEDVTNILIKLEYSEGVLNTSLTNIDMDSAALPDSGLGAANYVEECSCPVGYMGTSCEECAEGYIRHKSGQWLGQCYKEPESCPPGSYFDGRECQVCPCPYTSPSNQFARTCQLNTDGNVVCDCQPGYVGLRCEICAPGYTGNPLQPGDICRPGSYCDPQGSMGQDADGRCMCKEYTTGPTCNQCKANSFYLSSKNQFGCISCFCMGVTQQCTSSSWYRDTITSVFTSSINEFKLTDIHKEDAFTDGIRLNQDSREIAYSAFAQPEVYYWSLPNKYLGDKVTSYGGYLRYTIRNTPVPGGASSRNNAADVELVSENHINLQHFSSNKSQSTNAPQTFVVPLLEQYWQRSDGVKTDREHLLMALADVKNIYIKATYFTNTQEAALISVSLDTATDQNTGRERAYEVEQCHCPLGYTGLSCEDCAFGYTRSDDGIYLELCQPCECNGYSNECHPETGVCINCRDNTAGEQCEQCLPGFVGDPARGQPCRPSGRPTPCNCDPRGATYNGCVNGVCQCKTNVEGPNCDRCKNGTFGLSADNIDGCEFCFCSGVSTECSESQLYIEQIPVQVIEDHGFILTDQYFRQRITTGFKTNLALNEIGYNFPPSQRQRMYWSLPSIFTGNQIKSYGGKLEFMQRYIDFPHAQFIIDKDIIITGNGVVIYWTNPNQLKPEIVNSINVRLHPSANWYRLDHNKAPRSASREDILTVLANIDSILIRATPSNDSSSTFLSDITLDTAVDVYTAKPRATSVENCRCPLGYRGTSCESCASGYYKDTSYSDTNPLGSCRKCPCYNQEESCQFDNNQGVVCNCLPGYTGRHCESTDILTTTHRPNVTVRPPEPPSIEVTISGTQLQIYEIGSSVRLNCSAISRLAPRTVRIHWTKDNGNLPYHAIDDGRGILYIRNLTATDSGRYTCEAEDGYSIVTESINIAVGGARDSPPTIALSAPFIQASEGQPIEVRCASTGNPLPEFFLSRIDRQPLNPSHTFENGVFRILQARVTDAGVYHCTAVNRAGQDSKSFEVQVTAGSVLRVEIQPDRYEGNAGDQVVLRCIADRAPSIRWSKETGNLPYQSRDDNGILVIPNAQPDDSGIYVCTATSYDGTRGTQHTSVVIRGSAGVYPRARVTKHRLTLRQGESTEVTCEASGYPTPTVKWNKMSGVLGINTEQVGNKLIIRNARIDDRGVYICVVTNELGLEQDATTIEVTRFEPPLLQIYPEGSITVTAGNNAQLQCRPVQGYPSPTITWSRANDRPLSPNVELMSGGNLRIIGVTPSEAGEYVCAATNEAGTAKATASIVVVTSPELYITPDQEIITRAVNEYLRLECRGVGEPQPSVSWSRGADAFSIAGLRDQLKSVAIMEFTRLRPEDAGVYICVGHNDAGTTERRVQVDILPERGDNPVGIDRRYPGGDQGSTSNVEEFTAIVGARAELRCKISSSENIQHYVDWVRPDNLSLPEGAYIREGTLFIDQVQPSAAGDYDCVSYSLPSRNLLFKIRSRLRVVTPPHIILNPRRQIVEPGQNAYIQCSATGDPPIDIQWMPVNRTMPASVYTHDGYIRFSNIHHSDAGKYRCIARNAAGEADSVSEVVVSYQNPDTYQPTIEAENHQVTSSPGTTVSLRCRPGTGSEQYEVRWSREHDQLPHNVRLSGPILELFDLRSDNEGRYYCEIATPGGTVSDYVDLRVVVPQTKCPEHWWRCNNGNCISPQLVCDGTNDCQDNSDEITCEVNRRPRGPSVKSLPSPRPTLHITPQENEYQVGATVDLNCESNVPGVIPAWSKLGGGLADNVQNRAGRLRIYSVRPDNSGAYRCEATGARGNYYKDFNLYVKEEPIRDEIPLQVQRAKRKASVILECNTELEEPVSYFWSKQGGSLPFYVDEYSKTIQLNSVGAIDAGTYVCSATSQKRTLDIPIILVVTGIIPYFTQAPNSYISLPTLPDAYLQFSFEVSFKPENDYGLILYNGNREKERDADFISLGLENGIPEFKFNLGPGTPTTTVRSNETLTEREWHTIKIVRNKKRVIMFVDGKGPFIGENEGKYFGLDLSEPLFLGGVPDYSNISPEVMLESGFVGCISKFKIGYAYQDIFQEALNTQGITNCETCTENKCQNQGACQEALTTEGYTCICPAGFSGPTCNKRRGEACSPYSCGVGKCIDTENGFTCQCPLGRSGKNCEKTIQIFEPAFKDNAYIAYPSPRPLKRTRIEMRIKPKNIEDGILLYAAETNEGHGDFISLAIKDRHLEFRFDNGRGPYVIKSDQEIVPNKWSAILAIRSSQDGRIVINGHPSTPTRFTTNFKTLTLLTHLYVGGYDQHNVKLNKGVKVERGFNGCIMDINISGLDDSMMKNITDSSNVEDCGSDEEDIDNNIYSPEYAHETQYKPISYDNKKTGCTDNPCRNNAPCIPLSPVDYKCACSAGFTGKNCETAFDLCRDQPCQNGGVCKSNSTAFSCDCPLGFTGNTCDQRVELRNDAHFDGNGWLEFSKSLLPHRNDKEAEIVALEFSTNKSDGLIFWHGQGPNEDGQGQDYISLAVINGFLEFSYDLGSGPAIITNAQIKVDDGERHSVILKREGTSGTIDIDHTYVEQGESEGGATSMNCNGNIFLGGTPNVSKMTGSRFTTGFDGCIHGFELQQSKTLDLGIKSINGLNVKPCSSFNDIDNNIWNEELIN